MARIVRFHQTGGPQVLQIAEEQVAPPASGEVQIQVRAIGLNRAEVMFRNGQYLEVPQLPARLGYEAAGIVSAVGEDVTEFKPGDAVSTIPAFSQNQYGIYGELVNVPASAVAKHPQRLSWIEAAAVWMQYLTAYGALIDIADTKKDEIVLISASSSSVGLAAIELTNLLGAVPVALTRTSSKRESLLKAGAKHVIATEEQDLVAEVAHITGNKGARVVFDPVAGPALVQLAETAAQGGIIFEYGALSPEPTPLPLFTMLGKQLTIRGYTLFEITSNPQRLALAKQFIVNALSSGKLKPLVAKVFPFEQIVEAHRYMESNQQIGKIVVTVG
jgi:NADPH:quinone reductase-like Zn-dependent oxidoreductase